MKKLALFLLICLTVTGVSLREAAALGEVTEELVYTPLTPCRLIDTRNVGGAFAGNEVRSYNLIGPTDYSIYGGNAAGCGIPADLVTVPGTANYTNRVRGLVLNIIAVGPQNNGHFRAWQANQGTMPNASIINYAKVSDETNPSAQLNIANGLVLPTCDASCATPGCNPCVEDLKFYSSGISHLVVDVTGYMTQATNTDANEGMRDGNTPIWLQPNITGGGVCTPITSCAVTNYSAIPKKLLVIATANAQINHVAGTGDIVTTTISDTSAYCDPYPGPLNSGSLGVLPDYPTGCCVEGTISLGRIFQVNAGNTATYYLNARAYQGASDTNKDYIYGATIQCILLP